LYGLRFILAPDGQALAASLELHANFARDLAQPECPVNDNRERRDRKQDPDDSCFRETAFSFQTLCSFSQNLRRESVLSGG
jgi:hypothetical protein